jgi:hypothetical protein
MGFAAFGIASGLHRPVGLIATLAGLVLLTHGFIYWLL